MDAEPAIDAGTAMQRIDRLCTRVCLGLREDSLVFQDVVELACELLDWGHFGEAVREVVERDPAQVPAPEMADLARRILEETGFDPGFEPAPERLAVLRQALRVAARDLPTAGIDGEPRLVLLEDSTPVSAGIELSDGRLLAGDAGLDARRGDTPAGAVTAVAELIQDDLMKRTWQVWPICSDHRLGLHAVARQGAAVWWCTGGDGHFAALIGELAQRGHRSETE
ncbi:hypothetical protein ACWCRF_19580 [Streptomyces sp. NPDC002405]|uniref:hypothetical protein n=1 Tax=unclassified Streptomyces TaxID=2593676 RepID=UPI0036C7FBFF